MEIIFKILCGILYCIGLFFGYDYKEISVYICIYGCPIICILMSLILNITITNRLFKKVTVIKIILWLISCVYIAFNLTFFSYICQHYSGDVYVIFDQCVRDLQYIAFTCNTTYEYCNIVIYVYLFFSIIIANIITIFTIKNRNEKIKL